MSTWVVLPPTTVVPEMFDRNGSTCATFPAYTGAHRQATTITRKTTALPIAARSRTSLPSATRQGPSPPRPGGAASASPGSATTAIGCSLHPQLADQHVELFAELVVADPLRHEVDQFRV